MGRFAGMLIAVILLAGVTSGFADTTPAQNQISSRYTVAIFPFMNSQFLANWWQPLHDHIQQASQMDIQPVFPQNYAEVLMAAQPDNKTDMVIMPIHIYPYVAENYHDKPVTIFPYTTSMELFVRKESTVHSLHDLKGECIALPDELSLASLVTDRVFAEKGFYAQRDYTPVHLRSHDDVVMSIAHHDCEAGVLTGLIKQQMNTEVATLLRSVMILDKQKIAAILVAKPSVPQADVDAISRALTTFGKTAETKRHLSQPLYKLLRKPTARDFQLINNMAKPYQPVISHYMEKQKGAP